MELLDFITELERRGGSFGKFLLNCYAVGTEGLDIMDYISKNTFYEILTSSFLWDETPEGEEYWHAILHNNEVEG